MVASKFARVARKTFGNFTGIQVECKTDSRSGAYCSMVIMSLLCLPLELPSGAPARLYGLDSFVSKLPDYLSYCMSPVLPMKTRKLTKTLGQTYEGGISGSPDTEAHGAYAFCALACLCILGPPHDTIPRCAPFPFFSSETTKLMRLSQQS